jgi:hypothetical protein
MEAARDHGRHEALEFFDRRIGKVPDGGPRKKSSRFAARSDEDCERLYNVALRHWACSIRARHDVRRGRAERHAEFKSGGSPAAVPVEVSRILMEMMNACFIWISFGPSPESAARGSRSSCCWSCSRARRTRHARCIATALVSSRT